ncbi:MAG: diaminopimelate decarboxylase [Clostridiales bacterium]|nr:diaminopimelate decarboxylase [Clostridiales bacterium]
MRSSEREFVSEILGINEAGHMTIGGIDIPLLVEQYGTPLMVMDEEYIEDQCKAYRDALIKHYGENSLVAYAGKAFCTGYMYKILSRYGLGADVVSGGEIYTAKAADFDMSKLFFHGNNKTMQELRQALELGIGFFVVDNSEELELLNTLAGEMGKTAKILFRIKPGIDAHTHDYIKTGAIDSKFGLALETGEALSIIGRVQKLGNVEYVGIHCHIGSQIFESEPYEEAVKVMTSFIKEIFDVLGLETYELNLGGGFGIKYIPSHEPKTPEETVEKLCEELKKSLREKNLPAPRLIIEPGRSIVASAGITVYRVGSVKVIPGVRTYVAVDGGMTDNPRFALYGAVYEFELPEKVTEEKTETVSIAGRCCESGDMLGHDVKLQKAEAGDLLCTLATGAYCYSMSSNYNRLPRPPVVMVKNGTSKVVVKRESYEDLIKNDVF